MTKANDAARAHVKDAERRARRKIKRLQGKGVRTGSVSPFRDVDPSDTRALKSYANDLERFVSRSTRFVAGRDGTPIPYSAYRDYKRIERQWNREHDRYWRKFADQPFMTAYGDSDMTLGQRSAAAHVKGLPYGDIGYRRELLPGQIRSEKDLERRKKILKRELSPSYQRERVRQLRRNMMEHAATFNDERIPKAIRRLSNEQLFALQNFTSFVPLYFRYIATDRDNDMGTQADSTEEEAQKEHMLRTIEQVRQKIPKKNVKLHGQNKKDRAEGSKRRTAESLARDYNERGFLENTNHYGGADLRGFA